MHTFLTLKHKNELRSIITNSCPQTLDFPHSLLQVRYLPPLVLGQEVHHSWGPPHLELDPDRDQGAPGDDLTTRLSQIYLPLHEGRLAVGTKLEGKEDILDKTQQIF